MVATRRGARTGVVEDSAKPDANLAFRKKPIRKAAAGATTTAPSRPATKSRATRARKIEEAAQDSQDEQAEEGIEEAVEPPKTRQAASRTKRADAETVGAPATKSVVSRSIAKNTRATKAKSKKTEVHNDEAPEIQLEPKSRATRTTRAKAALEKTKVLSPKKVAQVSKGPLRATKASTAKISSRPALSKAAVPTRSTRRRAVSDENAEVPNLAEKSENRDEDGGKTAIAKTKGKSLARSKKVVAIEIESDTEMSSRPTTPTDSPKMDLSSAQEDVDENRQESDSQPDESDDETSSMSEDELCGPKTPMRRCSPREAARYSNSPTRMIPYDHSPNRMRTPTRLNTVIDRRRGTPQTQRPYAQIGSSVFDQETMTISRAANRSMVFTELKPLPTALKTRLNKITKSQFEDPAEDAVVPDDISSDSKAQDHQHPEMDFTKGVQIHDTSSPPEDVQPVENVESEQMKGIEPNKLCKDQGSPSDDLDCSADEEMTEFADEYKFELDATPHSWTNENGVELFEDDHSVIIASNRQALEQVSPIKSFENRLREAIAPTPKPETLVWENIRQDDTLVYDLGQGSDTPDTLPELDQTEILSPTASLGSAEKIEQNTPQVSEGMEATTVCHNVLQNIRETPRISMASNRPSLDGSIHLSQFINVDSLLETRLDDLHQQPCDLAMSMELDTNADCTTDSTPMRSPTRTRECDQVHVVIEPGTPRYAQPTKASAVKRRQSLPAISLTTPAKATMRPSTSDGASLPRSPVAQTFQLSTIDDPFQRLTPAAGPLQLRAVKSTEESIDTRQPSRPITPRANMSRPIRPGATTPRHRRQGSSKISAPQTVAGDRYHGQRVLPSIRTPCTGPSEETSGGSAVNAAHIANKERFPGLPSRKTYEELVETPTMRDVASFISHTPETAKMKRQIIPSTRMSSRKVTRTPISRTPVREETRSPLSSRKERYPGLPSRRTYEEHAKTAMVPTRFRNISQVPAKRPASAMKASSLSDLARRGARNSGTPTKTPLKPPGMTPGQIPMTPHPAAPLKGVYALVDVWTNDATPASSAFITLLQRLGARTTKSWSKHLTHVVFKSGSPSTLQRVRLHNKEVEDSSTGSRVYCVNSRWVTDCDTEGRHVDETDDEYVVDVEEACRGSKRRCKSMEPAALINIGGNVICDRKSSLGRASLGRSPLKQTFTTSRQSDSPLFDLEDKENSACDDDSSPVTPAYLAAPNLLIQQTAPMNRVRKLALGPKNQEKDRRTTVWNLEF